MTDDPAVSDRAWAALGGVLDPELDRPVTELGFVQRLEVRDGRAALELRLPTYFCAPNFAYLMVADARRALESLPEVVTAEVRLVDHFASDEINAGMRDGRDFVATFTGLADREQDADLEELRAVFLRKAHRAAQERMVRALLDGGAALPDLVHAPLRRAGDIPSARLVRRRRAALGLPAGPDAPLLLDDAGAPVPPDELVRWLRFSRTIGVSIEANTEFCEGLLVTRYGD